MYEICKLKLQNIFTHFRLNKLPHHYILDDPISILGISGFVNEIFLEQKWIGDPDQAPHSAASNLCLHCFPITFLGVSRLKWINPQKYAAISGYVSRETIGTIFMHTYFSLRKYAYSNIQKISPPKTENFQVKNSDIFIYLLKT